MECHEPGRNAIDEVVQEVGVRDAVDGRVDGEDEEEDVGDIGEPGGNPRHHLPASQGLDEEDEGHY